MTDDGKPFGRLGMDFSRGGNVGLLGGRTQQKRGIQKSLAHEPRSEVSGRNAGARPLRGKGRKKLRECEALGQFNLLPGIINTNVGKCGRPIPNGDGSNT